MFEGDSSVSERIEGCFCICCKGCVDFRRALYRRCEREFAALSAVRPADGRSSKIISIHRPHRIAATTLIGGKAAKHDRVAPSG